jgi:hypothetical protein
MIYVSGTTGIIIHLHFCDPVILTFYSAYRTVDHIDQLKATAGILYDIEKLTFTTGPAIVDDIDVVIIVIIDQMKIIQIVRYLIRPNERKMITQGKYGFKIFNLEWSHFNFRPLES